MAARILSITPSPQCDSSIVIFLMDQRVAKRLKDALDSMVYVPSVWQSEPVGEGPPAKGQVWDRRELFARLQTFRAANWFAKPEGIKPEDCARKGWRNAGPDLLACEVGSRCRDKLGQWCV